MSSNASAYKALGLKPGADGAAVEQAYKKLIKKYHPDRKGGDAARAAEINQAYFTLRKNVEQLPHRDAPVDLAEALYARRAARVHQSHRRRRRKRVWPFVVGLVLLIAALLFRDSIEEFAARWWAQAVEIVEPPRRTSPPSPVAPSVSLASPLESSAIADAVRLARRLVASKDRDAAIEASRACHREMRAQPSLRNLDRCAAFDDAVLEVVKLDPIREEGPFSASAVTARQMGAATLLTNDYEQIESRLDRVRARVQALLAPAPEKPPVRRDATRAQVGALPDGAHGPRRSPGSA
jgi:hypothetical protein